MRDFMYFMMQSSLLICLVLLVRRFGKKYISARAAYGMWLIPMVRLCLPFFLVSVALPVGWSSLHPYALVQNAVYPDMIVADRITGTQAVGSAADGAAEGSETAGNTAAGGAAEGSETAGSPAANPPGAAKNAADGAAEGGETAGSPAAGGTAYRNETVGAAAGTGSILAAKQHTALRIFAAALWAAGSLVTGSVLLYKNIRFFRWMKKAAKEVEIPAELAAAFGGKEKLLPVFYKKELSSPCLAGLLYPAIWVNDRAVQDEEVLRMVIRHEQMHYRQKDHIWNFCRNLLCVIYWFHPFVWWGAIVSARDAELSCDERVVEGMNRQERKKYGTALIGLLEESGEKPKVLDATTAMTGGKKEMQERILTIARRRRTKRGALTGMIVLLLAVGIVGCTRAQTAEGSAAERDADETGDNAGRDDGMDNADTEDTAQEEREKISLQEDTDANASAQDAQSEFAEEEIPKYDALFSAATSMGADSFLLDYADDKILIMHGYYGLVVYQYADGEDGFAPGIIDTLDLTVIGCDATQGDAYTQVRVSKDGVNIYLYARGAKNYYRYDRLEKKLYQNRMAALWEKNGGSDGLFLPEEEEVLYVLPEGLMQEQNFAQDKKWYAGEIGDWMIPGSVTGLEEDIPVWSEKTRDYMKALKARYDRDAAAHIVDEGWSGMEPGEYRQIAVSDLSGAEGKWIRIVERVDENGDRIENPYEYPAWFQTLDGSKKLSVRSFDELICSWGDLLFYRYDKTIYVTKDDAVAPYFSFSEEQGRIELFSAGKELGAYQRGSDDIGKLTFYDANFHVVKEYQNVRLEEFSESYYCLMDLDTGLYGYVDDSGKVAIPFEYSLAKGFHNGYAAVLEGAEQKIYYEDRTVKMYDNLGGRWGIIDKRGAYVIEPQEKYSNSFERDDLGKAEAHDINGPVEFSQVREDGTVDFVVRETEKVLFTEKLMP